MASNKNMSETSKHLNLDMDTTFVPITISDILAEVSLIPYFSMKSSKLEFYINLFEEELRKVESFQRELPHCMQLLQDGIERLKKEWLRLRGERERGEGAVVVTEELLPISSSQPQRGEENEGGGGGVESSDHIGDKKTWMSRVRLWTAPLQFHNGNESFPFKSRGDASVASKSITMAKEGKMIVPVKDGSISNHKKQRRCWSPELHGRFVDALHHLGGPYAATPKQIRELMQVDGLTNDEVKSHLQKYRLHIRKLPSSSEELLHERGSASHAGADEDGGEGDIRKP